jgi:hypothetical protein
MFQVTEVKHEEEEGKKKILKKPKAKLQLICSQPGTLASVLGN